MQQLPLSLFSTHASSFHYLKTLSLEMTTAPEVSVAAANAGELNQPKPRWMPLEGNPEVNHRSQFDILLRCFFFCSGFK